MRRAARQASRASLLAIAAAGVLPVHAAHARLVPRRERPALEERYKRAWCALMLRVFDVRARVLGEPPVARGGLLVVANHRSALDVPLLLWLFGGHMLSRADVSSWPLLGPLARRIGTVFVDRASSASGASAVREVQALLERGRTVTVFPEGTTFEGDEVRPLHRGAFLAAAKAGAAVLPVGLAYERGSEAAFREESFLSHLGRVAAAPPSRVAIAIGAPRPARGTPREDAEAARGEVAALIARARRRAPSP